MTPTVIGICEEKEANAVEIKFKTVLHKINQRHHQGALNWMFFLRLGKLPILCKML